MIGQSVACKIYLFLYLATKVVPSVIEKLPEDGSQNTPGDEVVINLCGILNNLVMHSEVAAREICFYKGIDKLIGIKTKHNSRCVM